MYSKILQINALDSVGGAGRVSYLLHNYYKEQGISSKMLVGEKRSNDSDIDVIKGKVDIRYITPALKRLKLNDFVPINNANLFSNPFYVNSNVIHLHNLHQGYFNLKNLERFTEDKKTVVWTFHDMWPITGNSFHTFGCERWREDLNFECNCGQKHSKYDLFLEKHLLRRKLEIYEKSNFIIVTPSRWLADLVQKSILKDKRIEIIPNGIDEKYIKYQDKNNLRSKLRLPRDKDIVCFNAHGGLKNIWKGGEYMEKALTEMRKKKDIVFLELGGDIDKRVDSIDSIRIPYTDDYKELYEYMQASDLFMFSSLAENFPLVLIEAQAVGLPTVTFDVGGAKEIVIDGKTGFVTEYKNAKQLALKGLEILDDKKLQEVLSKNSVRNFEEKYKLSISADKYLKLYEENEK